MCILQENLLFFHFSLGLDFSDYIVLY